MVYTRSIDEQNDLYQFFRMFTREKIEPFANDYDKQGLFPETTLQAIASAGFLGATIPVKYGGKGWNQMTSGVLNAVVGKACSSARSLLTVHVGLVSETLWRWGSEAQKEYWLPLLASGEKIAAFCLSEPEVGSDAKSVNTTYDEVDGDYILNGVKKWTTFGQRADLFMVVARSSSAKVSAFLVERKCPGVEIKPISGMLGTRASMVADVSFRNCRIARENLVGREGWGFLQIVNTALDNGRFSVAFGTLGIAKACLEESINYAKRRKQFGVCLADHQLIKQKISVMATQIHAASLLCKNAAVLRDRNSPDAIINTSMAKYFTAKITNDAAREAVQIHGAVGCHEDLSLQRYFRDAKIMEIIEGTNEIQELVIADLAMMAFDKLFDY